VVFSAVNLTCKRIRIKLNWINIDNFFVTLTQYSTMICNCEAGGMDLHGAAFYSLKEDLLA
jgi:hypothetical protein